MTEVFDMVLVLFVGSAIMAVFMAAMYGLYRLGKALVSALECLFF